ncbi:MAG: ATP-grasp domain-containing protein [Mesorhizobium sp.]|uniref:ATP-grasp domain-containing protein n=1 Tax=Mesorhizobium sp. TaxID=1871066 RepID=UPI000FE46665|nr:acetyl-CoA carboxylase biotin carboxylase subunit family protein [Mesorhizobium sp.]RWM67954.1 MAG: ATP-grasp domain-containing protein [Mesorhizobium sp.]RWN51867.1 MAG: ATP-grasp domain-containing protein [Mesorhizobium sp.]RWN61085.1 MAG: ATP-grasp domain-containing protein [Mesorhizobium sp.]TIO13811.1 MAG: ATP-grasp domain-containing protein [Mesorhizobium sp.]TIR30066.1 MAG: ATP-grasp domain-containing protein [Mesorhizobium sp.]
MARRALILIEGHRGNGLAYVQAARRLGLHPITLSADPAQYDYVATESVQAIRVDTDDLDAMIHECSQLRTEYDIAGITGFSGDDELVYMAVAKLCRRFDLPGPNPASIERCCDKFVQRQILTEAGVPMPTYRLAANATEIETFAAEIGLPVILKPAEGSGSKGVRLCRSVDELVEHTTYLLKGKYIWRSPPRVLIEEFAQGPLYNAQIMGREIVGFSESEFGPPPHFVSRELTFPILLPDQERELISDVSLTCLQALGLGWGPTNIEFRWTKRGPAMIEVNPRLGGAPDPQLVQLACGVDLITEHVKLVIGDEWKLVKSHSHTATARKLIADRDGILERIDGHGRAAAIPGVADVKFYVQPETPIITKGDSRDCIGYVIAASPSRARTKAILQRAVDLIDWQITPFATPGEREPFAASDVPDR